MQPKQANIIRYFFEETFTSETVVEGGVNNHDRLQYEVHNMALVSVVGDTLCDGLEAALAQANFNRDDGEWKFHGGWVRQPTEGVDLLPYVVVYGLVVLTDFGQSALAQLLCEVARFERARMIALVICPQEAKSISALRLLLEPHKDWWSLLDVTPDHAELLIEETNAAQSAMATRIEIAIHGLIVPLLQNGLMCVDHSDMRGENCVEARYLRKYSAASYGTLMEKLIRDWQPEKEMLHLSVALSMPLSSHPKLYMMSAILDHVRGRCSDDVTVVGSFAVDEKPSDFSVIFGSSW